MHNSNIVGIIQARMGSTRLPNKMMLHLHGYPIVQWLHERLKGSKFLSSCVFAIPDTKENDVLEYFLNKIGADVYRGSEHDLVDRYFSAAKLFKASHIIRICGDNPLVCSTEVDSLIKFYFDSKNIDYAYNHIPRDNCYPDGFGAEICSIEILNNIFLEASASQREHLFDHVWSSPSNYSIGTFDPPVAIRYPAFKFDINNYTDYQYLLSLDLNISMDAEQIVNQALSSC